MLRNTKILLPSTPKKFSRYTTIKLVVNNSLLIWLHIQIQLKPDTSQTLKPQEFLGIGIEYIASNTHSPQVSSVLEPTLYME